MAYRLLLLEWRPWLRGKRRRRGLGMWQFDSQLVGRWHEFVLYGGAFRRGQFGWHCGWERCLEGFSGVGR